MKTTKKKTPAAAPKDPNRYPKGWNRKRVQKLIDHYENQTDEEAIAEDEAAYHDTKVTMMAVPVELVPAVQRLISRKRAG
jgi:hypothetical protein